MLSTAHATAARRGPLAATIAAVMIVLAAGPAMAAPQRVAGTGRIGTAVAASQLGWETADTVVLATAGDFPDALAATALAVDQGGPLLLTADDRLPAAVGAEIERLDAERVVVLGGERAVGEPVVDQVASLATAPAVDRIAGDDRFATAAAVAAEGGASEEAVVVVGDAFPDAVSAGALAVGDDAPPVLLVRGDTVPQPTLDAITELGVDEVSLVGGPAAVSETAARQLTDVGVTVDRLAGSDRYWTSAQVAREAERRGGGATAVFATGAEHADALAAGVLAARHDGLLLLASPSQPHPANDEFLRERAADWTGSFILGGTRALGDDAAAALSRSLHGEPHPEPEPEPEPESEAATGPGEAAVDAARAQIGTPYRYGGNGPGSFDCSGLTSWAWRAAGTALPRTSGAQFADAPSVPRAQARPGDLVAWGSPVHHVAIYAGDGMMIEAPSSGGHVREVPLRSGYRGFARPGG